MGKKVMSVVIPPAIRKAWEEYEGATDLDTAVAIRFGEEWCGILFKDEDGELSGIDFVHAIKDGAIVWDVQNDYIGPFDSVKQFMQEDLVRLLA